MVPSERVERGVIPFSCTADMWQPATSAPAPMPSCQHPYAVWQLKMRFFALTLCFVCRITSWNRVALPKKNIPAWRKSWHNENDLNLRKEIFSHITKLVQKHGLENRLPAAIATELENALYLDADSKDDYGDLSTLERRICSVMLRLRNSQKAAQAGAPPGSTIPETTLLPANNTGYPGLGVGRVLPVNNGPRVLLGTGSASTVSASDVGSYSPTGRKE